MAKKNKKELFKAAQPAQKLRVPAWAAWGAFGLWGFWVFKNYLARFTPDLNSLFVMLSPEQYFSGNPLMALPGHAVSLGAGLAFLAATAGLGRFLLINLAKAGPFDTLEEAVFSAALGLAVFAHAVLALAAAGFLYTWPVAALLAVSAGLGVYSLKSSPPAPQAMASFRPEFPDFLAFTLLAAALAFGLAGALSPEIFYDSLVYHLAVPNLYALKHGFADMPYNLYSNLFLLHGMLYSAGLLLTDEMLPKFINYAAGALSVAAVVGLGRRHFTFRIGLWAALIFYTVAHTQISAWSSGTEALLTLFSLCALAAALRHEPGEKKFLLLAAFLAGCGMAVKTTGLFPAVGIGLVLLYRGRANPAAALRSALLFGLVAALPVLPWLVKNQVYRHNPFFPFLTSVFGLPATADAAKIQGFMGETRQMGSIEFKAWLLHPWKITMGEIGNSHYFTPLFLALLPLLFIIPPAAGTAPLWIYFATGWLLWSFASTMVRFLMPAYPAAALLIAASLEGRGHVALRRTLSYAALACCALGLYWAGLIFYSQGRWKPVLGLVSKKEYLSNTQATYPYSHYAAIEFINEKLPAGSKTLIIGDGRSFYFKKDFIVSSVFDKTPVVEYAAASASGEELYARLRAEGVTHLLINAAEAIKLGVGYRMFYWDARARGVFDEFWARHAREVFARDEVQSGRFLNRVTVYELAAELPRGTPPAFNVMKEIIMKNIEAKR
ncbi:MAG TPA: hypothetical protein DCS63_05310 [Elusimicrobia bacterium]|nr:hypothetical protein [Elusimicrobiota bacterium]